MKTSIDTPWESGTITVQSGPLDDGSFCATIVSNNPAMSALVNQGFPLLSLNLLATNTLIAVLQAAVSTFEHSNQP